MKRLRDDAAAAAASGIRALGPVVDNKAEFNETDRLRRESIALRMLYKILFFMKTAGAPVDDVE
jgi:hypothetical protein